MSQQTLRIPPGVGFWAQTAQALLDALPLLQKTLATAPNCLDFSGVRIVVPTFEHAAQLRLALHHALGTAFITPRITTLSAWLALQPPEERRHTELQTSLLHAATGNERLMLLYAELRQHVWLKKLFGARRNTDLLPLAQTLLTLADELTAALLPGMATHPEHADARWESALSQLPPSARTVLSEEAQLVWAIWKTQLGADDPGATSFSRMLRLAAQATYPLIWIAPAAPDACAEAFLAAWAARQPVLTVQLDWRAPSLPWALCRAWPELVESASTPCFAPSPEIAITLDLHFLGLRLPKPRQLAQVSLSPANSLEDEASRGAQTIVDWLGQGKTSIAIVVQDRVVARRLRALLQRAQVQVADETGWKLSTTRAAASLVAWFDVVTTRAQNTALLDFLKSPFLLEASQDHADIVMIIEMALRCGNVAGGWRAVIASIPPGPARVQVQCLETLAGLFRERRSVVEWTQLTVSSLNAIGMETAYRKDAAGQQVIKLLSQIARDCHALLQQFSFSEWRAFMSMQLESTTFVPPVTDRRVVMLPLHCMVLRSFDAVLIVGADAAHLPSPSNETLFFANPVRQELGLATREWRHLQQLREFAEVLSANAVVVISWQFIRDGEPNAVNSWVERLALALALERKPELAVHQAQLPLVDLVYCPVPTPTPTPAAPELLPNKLSASGYSSLVACPYQFFATRMLGLSGLKEFSEQPEKRDYGDWLHQILNLFHTGLRDRVAGAEDRQAFLQQVTEQVFAGELRQSGAALGYYDRWQKAMPAYLNWAVAHEEAGWTFVSGEQWHEQPLRWPGGEIMLHGRIDRIDHNDAGEMTVIDYKTAGNAALKKKLEGNEDHQLAFYGLLSATPPESAHLVGLEPHKDKISSLSAMEFGVWQEQLRQQIVLTIQALAGGSPMRASGIEAICQYCEVRGLCRKGAW